MCNHTSKILNYCNSHSWIVVLLLTISCSTIQAQGLPELMYYKFNQITGGQTPNSAPVATMAGNPTATVTGMTIGGSGQFLAGLQGTAGTNAAQNVNPGWTGTHTGSWTISFWMNVPTPPTTRYMFGNSTGNGTFRCFIGGAAVGIRLTGGVPSITLDMPNWQSGPKVVTYVYDQIAGTVSGYINGVYQLSVPVGSSYPLVGTNFYVGSQGTAIDGTMDEFRLYNRALTQTEITNTWNQPLPLASGPNNAGITELTSPIGFCGGVQNIKVKIKNWGSSVLNSLQVQWRMNGIVQPAYTLSAPLDTFGGTGINEMEITLGTYSFGGAGVNFSANTYLPNGSPDNATYNDSLETVLHSSLSGTYTINAALPASATNYQNFTSFSNALNTYGVCGPVVANVAPATPYNEFLELGNIAGASAVNTIKINGNGATLQYANNTNDRQLLILNGAKYVKIDSLNFKSLATDFGWGALITNNASYDSITRCTFNLTSVTSISSANVNGITFSGSATAATTSGLCGTYCYIGGNHIVGATGTGGPYYAISISAGGNDNNVIDNNEIKNFYYYGTYISSANNTVLKGNDYHKTTKTGSLTTFYGIYLTGTSSGTKIIGNRLHDPRATAGTGSVYGIYNAGEGTSAAPNLIANNAIYNINQSGLIYSIYNSTSPYTYLYHNTITIDQILTSTSAVYGIYFTGTNTGSVAKNNNISITGGTTGAKYGFYYSTASSITDAQKNNIYVNSTQSGTQYYGYYTTAYATQAAFQTAYPTWEVGSTTADPQFASAVTGDLTPGNMSLYGSGENLLTTVPVDILGVPRSQTPTPGAFELTSTATNEAGVIALINPSGTFCTGNQAVTVKIANGGVNIINNIQVQWSLNGVAQPTVTYTTPINTLSSPSGNTANILLGNVAFTAAPTVIKAWTHLPNGVADTINVNDTLEVTVAASLSGTVTVNSALPTAGTNYQSFTALANALNTYGVCGPVVANVVPGSGPYNEFVKFNNISGTSPVNTIRINGNGAVVQFSNNTTNRQLLTLSGTKYLRIDSVNFKALATDFGWGALITNGCRYDSITNCMFDLSSVTSISSAQNAGITFSGSETAATTAGDNGSFCYISGNHLKGSDGTGGMYYCISVATGGNNNNIFRSNELENFYYYGMYLSGIENTIVEGNNLHKTNKTGSITTFYGIYLTGTTPGVKLLSNRIHNPAAASATSTPTFYGIAGYGDATAAAPVVIANNVIYNINKGGIVYGMYFSTASENLVYHNSITIDAVLGSTSADYGIYATGTNANTKFKNNNISITAGGTGLKYGFYYSTAASAADAQRNNVYVNSNQSGGQYYGYISSPYLTIADFQNAFPLLETGSLSVDPLFVNPAAGNLAPANFSLFAAGTGLNTVVPVDIINVPRSVVPTPGAYELPPTGLNNAGSVSILSPKGSFCDGPQPVKVSILNAGTNNITQLQIHWEINGVAQPTYNYTNTLTSVLNPGQFLDTVELGTATFTIGNTDTIRAWTYQPNNTTDSYLSNDTVTAIVEPSSFTVDAALDTLCPTGSTTIALTPSSGYYSGQINWQSSPDGNTWTDIANSGVVNYNTGVLPGSRFFRVKVNGGTSACFSDATKILVVSPQIITANNVSMCGEGSASITATASNNSIVKWYDNATATVPVSIGVVFNTPVLTDTTTFYVAADIGGSTSSCATAKVPVTVYVIPKPEVDLGPDINPCVDLGTVLDLDAGALPNNVTYLWDDNSTGQIRQINESGTYSVIVTNEYQCVGGDTVTVNILPNPATNIGNDTTVCIGSSLVLHSGVDNALSYYWITGQTSESITVTNPGTYAVFVTANNGCTKSDTINVAMQGEMPSIQGIQVANNSAAMFQFSVIDPMNIISYEWNFGDGSAPSNDPAPLHLYQTMGNFIVTLKISSTCGYVLDTAFANIVGVHELQINKSDLSLFPNPSTGMATLKNNGTFKMKHVEVYNMVGQLVYSSAADSDKQHTIDLNGMSSGIYNIVVLTDKGNFTRKLEILK